MASTYRTIVVLLVLGIECARGAQTSSIVLTPDEKVVCAVQQDAVCIALWNWAADGSIRLVTVGEDPRTLAASPDGRHVVVTHQSSQTLGIVDVAQGRMIREIALGGQPYGVLISPDGRRAYFSQYAGGYVDGKYHAGLIAVVDLAAGRVIARIPVRARPWAMAMGDAAGDLYVTHYLGIDGQGWVTQIDAVRLGVVREIALREDDNVRDGQGGVFNALAGIAIHPNGTRAVVAGMHANVRRGTRLNGQPLSHKTTVQAAIRVIDLAADRELYDARINSSFSGQAVAVPSAVAFVGSTGCYLDVYFASNDFKVIQYNERGVVAERSLRSLPPGPTGVAITRDGRTAFFNNRWDRSLSHFSLVDPRNPTLVKTVRVCPEPWDPQRLQGAILFHNTRDTRMTANRWVSCAACHLDGGVVSDGLVWDLTVPGAPPKIGNTMDLVNMPGSSPPFFHRGTPNVVEALERFVLIFQQGSGFLDHDRTPQGNGQSVGDWDRSEPGRQRTSPEWAAMLSYMGAMRARPNPHMDGPRPRPEIRAAAERGRTLFFDPATGCAHCHGGPTMTVSGQLGVRSVFDVGTGKEVDTPSLLNLWDTAPYLHDGRAKTLLDVLTTHNRQDRHGKTSHLDARQRDDLASYMLAPCAEESP